MMKIKSDLEISDEQLVKVDTRDFDDMEKVNMHIDLMVIDVHHIF